MPASAIAGTTPAADVQTRELWSPPRRWTLRRIWRSLLVRVAALMVVFAAVPLILYHEFGAAAT